MPDEEHHERRHEKIAVRADGQVDRHEVLPPEDDAGRQFAESPQDLGGCAEAGGHRERTPSTQEGARQHARDAPAVASDARQAIAAMTDAVPVPTKTSSTKAHDW